MNKSTRIALAVVVSVLVLAAIGYFAVLPAVQISGYKKDAEAKHQQLNDKMLRVHDSFKRGAFTSADSTPESDKLDVQVGRDAVKDAEDTLAANAAAMTEFTAHPMLGWNKRYKQATDTDAAENDYLKQARVFLAGYKVLLDYTDKSDDIGIKMGDALKDLSTIGSQPTPAAMAKMIDADVAKIQPMLGDYKALLPPAYLKANTDAQIVSVGQLVATLQDLSTGARTLNLDRITKASNDSDREIADLDKLSKDFVDTLQHKSPIQDQVSKLRDLNATIAAGYAKL